MAGFNSITLMGTVSKIEHKTIGTNKLCKFILKSVRTYEAKGTTMQDMCYIEVSAWNKLAERCENELCDTATVLVEGSLKQETWDDNNGNKRYKHIIVASNIAVITEQDMPTSEEYTTKKSEDIKNIRTQEEYLPF
jgi:single-strand DNA-binding protein